MSEQQQQQQQQADSSQRSAEERHKCSECSKEFVSRRDLGRHKLTHDIFADQSEFRSYIRAEDVHPLLARLYKNEEGRWVTVDIDAFEPATATTITVTRPPRHVPGMWPPEREKMNEQAERAAQELLTRPDLDVGTDILDELNCSFLETDH